MANTKPIGVAYEDQVLDGATIDNSVIGGTTAAAGTFTTMTCTTAVVGGNTLSGTELGYVDGITTGTVTASKAVVVDANKDIGDFRNLDAVNIDAGASGTAGSVDVFPTTASKGKVAITAADSAGDTTTTIVNASQAGARTYTIPDAGASASFVMTEGAQAVNGVKTMASANIITHANTGLLVQDTGGDHKTTIKQNSNEAADRIANIPALGGDDTFAMLGVVNAFTGANTFTEGVASGTARKFVGSAFVDVAATDAVTAVASNNSFIAFAQTYSIPANTVKAGTRIKAKAVVRVTDASGTDTLTCEIRVGGTSITATTAVDPGTAGDHHAIELEFVGREAAAASAACSAYGQWRTNTGGTVVHGSSALAAANYATNGALVVDVRAKWSSNTANTSCNLDHLSVEVIG